MMRRSTHRRALLPSAVHTKEGLLHTDFGLDKEPSTLINTVTLINLVVRHDAPQALRRKLCTCYSAHSCASMDDLRTKGISVYVPPEYSLCIIVDPASEHQYGMVGRTPSRLYVLPPTNLRYNAK